MENGNAIKTPRIIQRFSIKMFAHFKIIGILALYLRNRNSTTMKPVIRLVPIRYEDRAYIGLSFEAGHDLPAHIQKIPHVAFLTSIKTWAIALEHFYLPSFFARQKRLLGSITPSSGRRSLPDPKKAKRTKLAKKRRYRWSNSGAGWNIAATVRPL